MIRASWLTVPSSAFRTFWLRSPRRLYNTSSAGVFDRASRMSTRFRRGSDRSPSRILNETSAWPWRGASDKCNGRRSGAAAHFSNHAEFKLGWKDKLHDKIRMCLLPVPAQDRAGYSIFWAWDDSFLQLHCIWLVFSHLQFLSHPLKFPTLDFSWYPKYQCPISLLSSYLLDMAWQELKLKLFSCLWNRPCWVKLIHYSAQSLKTKTFSILSLDGATIKRLDQGFRILVLREKTPSMAIPSY